MAFSFFPGELLNNAHHFICCKSTDLLGIMSHQTEGPEHGWELKYVPFVPTAESSSSRSDHGAITDRAPELLERADEIAQEVGKKLSEIGNQLKRFEPDEIEVSMGVALGLEGSLFLVGKGSAKAQIQISLKWVKAG